MTSVLAVYENGVLRPREPLNLAEGQEVTVTVTEALPPLKPLRPPTPEEEDYARRLKAAKNIQELFAVMDTAPPDPNMDENFDIVKAINESRRLTGFRMPDPEGAEGPQ